MKKLALVFLMLQTAFLLAAPDKPTPSDFTVTVHVVSSASLITGNVYFQVLETVINGQPVELQESSLGVLALRTYP